MKSDEEIKRDVEAELKWNPNIDATDIAVAVKDGVVTGFILESVEVLALEAVAVDDAGNLYGGYTNTLNFRRWVKKN